MKFNTFFNIKIFKHKMKIKERKFIYHAINVIIVDIGNNYCINSNI